MEVAENVRFWSSIFLQVAALVCILHYINSSLPFCYRQNPSDEKRICITPNASTCHTWISNQVQWIEQGLSYRSNDRICIGQIVWLMKSLVYANFFMISAQMVIKRRSIEPSPNGLAFAYFTAIDTVALFLLNYYMKNDWRTFWKSAPVYTFSNAIRHEPLAYLTITLFLVQFASFLEHFYHLYRRTWSKW
ncbi:hypothetical protein V3C99_013840 [Haemonchus contortus]